jgi:hypothetical protein
LAIYYVIVYLVHPTSIQLQDYTQWVKKLIADDSKNIIVQQRHIEKDRIWREINLADIRRVLVGVAFKIRTSDRTLIWRGKDSKGRLIELLCSLITQNGVDTLFIQEAHSLRVGTAYQPNINDEELKLNWLKSHPDYELGPGGKVVKKIILLK